MQLTFLLTAVVAWLAASASSLPTSSSPVVVGYYADWTTADLPPESIPFAKLTHINYAFAILSANYTVTFQTGSTLQRVVQAAHAAHCKVLISIGGWTGSQYFSPMAASASSRQTFIQSAVNIVRQYNLDGVDLDWEYPGKAGDTCNKISPQDTANFQVLLGELRTALGSGKDISAAASITPWVGSDGQPLQDVSAFLPNLDRISVMAYDINGVWSKKTGPNAPLNGAQSFTSSIKAWTDAKWPAERLVMGLPLYGRAVQVTANPSQYGNNPANGVPISSNIPQGDGQDALYADVCAGTGATYSGIWQWRNLRKQGVLTTPTQASAGWTRGIDATSSTPWLFNAQTNMFISYDDPDSLAAKVNAAKCSHMGGVMVWDLHQDNGELLTAVTSVLHGAQGKC